MNIVKVIIHRGPVSLPIDGRSAEEAFHIKDRESGIFSVKDAILQRLGAWPNGAEGFDVKAHLAAIRALDRAFVVRCPYSAAQIDEILEPRDDADTYEWI